jgi:hypothetical protein
MSSRTPLHGGIVVALLWIALQVLLWAAVAVATAFLSLLAVSLILGTLNPDNWKALRP